MFGHSGLGRKASNPYVMMRARARRSGVARLFGTQLQEVAVAEIAKIIEIVGSSPKSWDEAAENAVRTASKTVNNITGVEVEHMTAKVEGGEIVSYKTTVKIAFGVGG